MINIFGTPGIPTRISDAVIISSTVVPISVGTVYIFYSRPLQRLYKFEDAYASELVDTYENITGYFSFKGWLHFEVGSFSIISKNDPRILFRLESVTINKTNNTADMNTYTTAVKFKARRLLDLCRWGSEVI